MLRGGGQVGGATDESPWHQIQKQAPVKNLADVYPAFKLLGRNMDVGKWCDLDETTPSYSTPSLEGHAQTVLMALHLVYEVSSLQGSNIVCAFS